MTSSRRLETTRLLLPPLTLDHTDDMARVYADPAVARFVGGGGLTSETIPLQVADFADEWDLRGYGQSAVIDRKTGVFLGRIGLHYWRNWDAVELGYILDRSAQGKGIAAEASRAWIDWVENESSIDQLIANIHPENTPSIGLAAKLGFHFDRHDETPSGKPTLIYRRETQKAADSAHAPN